MYCLACACLGSLQAQPRIYDETFDPNDPLDGTVIMEAENTDSDFGEWILNTTTDVSDLTGTGAIEFTGNSYTSGPVNSPLEYRFRINKGGIYHLELHAAKLNQANRTDVANDCFIKLTGNFDAVNPDPLDIPNNSLSYSHEYHNNDAPLEVLRSHYKFFGGNNNQFVWESGSRIDLGGEGNKRRAEYRLYAGEIYTFTISGRSRDFKINRILFRHNDQNTSSEKSTVRDLSNPESALLAEADIPNDILNGAPQDQPLADDTATETLDTPVVNGLVTIGGQLKRWHKVDLTLTGPSSSETATPNPFTDYRMEVVFTHSASGLSYTVPGYFAADGNALNTSATGGDKWRAHLSPDKIGVWDYEVLFREGADVAISGDSDAGTAVSGLNGLSGSFTIVESDKSGFDFRSPNRGRLSYVGERFLQFAGSGEYFMKAGPDSPENMLAYEDFDDTPNDRNGNGNLRKSWAPHADDYDADDAAFYTWTNPGTGETQGTEILGALRYLSGTERLNSFSFLTFNLDGDDDNVFPHLLIDDVAAYEAIGDDARWDASVVYHDRFDVSKMAQWERIMAYATKRGMLMDIKTQETENDLLLDGGYLGRERKLYYRELMARFGHNLGVTWNLGEENDMHENNELADTEQTAVKSYTQFFHENDPYRHLTVIHTYPGGKNAVYGKLKGEPMEPFDPDTSTGSYLTGASLQMGNGSFNDVYGDVSNWVEQSAEAGRPWVVFSDEPGNASIALAPDLSSNVAQEYGRKQALWGTVMAGGAGANFYFGYQEDESDLTLQDFRSRDEYWDYCRYMLQFFSDNNIPFHEMSINNAISSNTDSWVLSKAGDVHLIYLKFGGETTVDLTNDFGNYTVDWYDPRKGGALRQTAITEVSSGSSVNLGTPPISEDGDWVILLRNTIPLDIPAIVTASLPDFVVGAEYSIELQSRGEDGPLEWSVVSGSLPSGLSFDTDNGVISGVPVEEAVTDIEIQIEDASGDTFVQSYTITIVNSARVFSDDFEDDFPLDATDQGLSLRGDVDAGGEDIADVGKAYGNPAGDYQVQLNPEANGNSSSQVLFMNAIDGSQNSQFINGFFDATIPVDGLEISFDFYSTVVNAEELHSSDSVRLYLIGEDDSSANAQMGIYRDGKVVIDGSTVVTGTAVQDAWQSFEGIFIATDTPGEYDLYWTYTNIETAASSSGVNRVDLNDGDWSLNSLDTTVANGIRMHVEDRKNRDGYFAYFDNLLVRYYSPTVKPEPIPEIQTVSLADAPLNRSYSIGLEVIGLGAPFEWTIIDGALPEGLSLSLDGIISGTADTLGTSNFTVQVEDSDGDVDTQEFTLNVIQSSIFQEDFEDDSPLDTTNSGLALNEDVDGLGEDQADIGLSYSAFAGEYQIRVNPETLGNTSSQVLFMNQIGSGTQDDQFINALFENVTLVNGLEVQFDFYSTALSASNLDGNDSVRLYLLGSDQTSVNAEIRLDRDGDFYVDGVAENSASPVQDAWQRFRGIFQETGTPGEYDLSWTLTNLETASEVSGSNTVNLNDGDWALNGLDFTQASGVRLYVRDRKNAESYLAYFDNIDIGFIPSSESKLTFEDWLESFVGIPVGEQGENADPDLGGLSNLMEFALGGDPTNPSDDYLLAPGLTVNEGADTLVMEFVYRRRQDPAAHGLSYEVFQTDSLKGTWLPAVVSQISAQEDVNDSEFEFVTSEIELPADATKHFVRLSVSDSQ